MNSVAYSMPPTTQPPFSSSASDRSPSVATVFRRDDPGSAIARSRSGNGPGWAAIIPIYNFIGGSNTTWPGNQDITYLNYNGSGQSYVKLYRNLAVNETQLANKLRDVREAEERIPVLEERALRLDERQRGLDRVASDLDERGAWLTEAVARVEAREREAADAIERAAAEVRRVQKREEEFEERSVRLDDRDRRLSEAYEALTERRRRIREDELGLQPREPA